MAGHRNLLTFNCPYSKLSSKELEDMGNGIEESFIVQVDLAEKKETILTVLLKDLEKNFSELEHVPSPDVYCKETGAQYYYHAHRQDDREEHEHGHFHTFLDLKVARPDLIPDTYEKARALTQIVGISLTNAASVFRLFATNVWVTDNVFIPAEDLIEVLKTFSLKSDTRYPEVSTWVGGIVKGFMPQIVFLLKERDKAIKKWQLEHSYLTLEEAMHDRNLEIPSSIVIDILAHANGIEEELDSR